MKRSCLPFVALSCLAVVIGTGGCYQNPSDIEAFFKPQNVFVTSEDYIILPPDVIVTYCPSVQEIDGQQQTVRSDGKISFPVVGEIEIAGKTPTQAAVLIRERLGSLYDLLGDYPVEVRVLANRSKFFYVYGEVQRPGPQQVTGRDSLLHAVSQASPTVTAWVSRIRVIRPSEQEGEKPFVFIYNLNKLLYGGRGYQNVLLQPGDVVYVQPTVLASVGKFVGQLVQPVSQAAQPAFTIQRISVGTP